MKETKNNLVKMKRLVVLNLVLTVIVLVLDVFVAPRLCWGEHPDGEYIYELVEDAIVILIMPIVINIVLVVYMLILWNMTDKLKIFKTYVLDGILGILVNVFQARLAVNTAVTHFDRMSLDGNIVAQAYVFINVVLLAIGVISVAILFAYVIIIKISVSEKKKYIVGKADRWN